MDKSISSDLIRGHIDTIILHSLFSGDKHAQQISDYVADKSGRQYEINQATLYSSLKRLETSKYVKAYWHDTDNGRRRFFSITDAGKEVVDTNLSSWSYSRSIIDRLMDLEPERVVKKEIIFSAVSAAKSEESQNDFLKTPDKFTENNKNVLHLSPIHNQNVIQLSATGAEQKQNTVLNSNNPQNVSETQTNKTDKTEFAQNNNSAYLNRDEERLIGKTESKQEINYKNILNGLIKTTNIVKEKTERLEPITRTDEKSVENSQPSDNSPEIQKLNDTISSENISSKIYNIGNINYGDLELKAEKNGYRLLVSSKETKITSGIYINKIKLASSLATFLVCLLEVLIFTLVCKPFLTLNAPIILGVIAAFTVYPIVCAVIYYKNPTKISQKNARDTLLTSLIVAFNLILLCVAINLLCNVDFGDRFSLSVYLIVPLLVIVDVVIFYLSAYAASKLGTFKVKDSVQEK